MYSRMLERNTTASQLMIVPFGSTACLPYDEVQPKDMISLCHLCAMIFSDGHNEMKYIEYGFVRSSVILELDDFWVLQKDVVSWSAMLAKGNAAS